MATTRERFEALHKEMAEDQQNAIMELHAWFTSDEGKAFADKWIGVQQRTIPNSHYDQILSGCLSVMNNAETMCKAMADAVQQQEASPDSAVTEPTE